MASIKKYAAKSAKNGYMWRVQYRDARGVSRTKSGFANKTQAETWAAQNTVNLATGEWLDPKDQKTTVGDLGALWIKTRTHLKPSTYRVVEQDWRVHVEPRWGATKVSMIKPSQVQEWVSTMERSASKVRAMLLCLAQILDVAVKDGIIRTNPARGVTLPKKSKSVKIYLPVAELKALADECTNHKELIWLLGTSGLRWGEAVALRPMDLDPLRNRISIVRNAVTVGSDCVIGTTKSHENRTVAVAPSVMSMLVKLADGRAVDDLLWPRSDGTPLRVPGHGSFFHGAVERVQKKRLEEIEEAKKSADLKVVPVEFPSITPHGLRHVAAGLLVQSGANVKAVQRQLGHASAAMTLDVYAELFDDGLDEIVEALDGLVVDVA